MLELDEFQSQVITDEYKPNKALIVKAGAGSGKSATILCKALMLTETVPPESIVALAFGNKAARELQIRYSGMKPQGSKSIVCSTIHSFGRLLSKQFLGIKATVLTEWKSILLMRDCLNELNIVDDTTPKAVQTSIATELLESLNEYKIQSQRIMGFSLQIENEQSKQTIELYEQKKQENNFFDYTDMLYVAYTKLLEQPDVLQKVRETYKVFLVDEAQDIDTLQYLLITLIAKNAYTIFVGDIMQTIYKFRFASPDKFSRKYLSRTYSEINELELRSNYRSTKNIVSIGNRVREIAFDKLRSVPKLDSKPGSVNLVTVKNNIQEGTKAANYIKEHIERGTYEYKDISIICRSNSYIKSTIEPALIRENIPYKLMSSRSGNRFSEKDTTNIIMDILSLVCNENDIYALFDLATYMKGVGVATAERLKNSLSLYKPLSDKDKATYKRINDMLESITKINCNAINRVTELIQEVCKEFLDYNRYFYNEIETLSLMNALGFWVQHYYEQGYRSLTDIADLILTEVQDFDTDENENLIKIHTVHSSKGLEFPVVVATGFNSAIKKNDEYQDEAYILYVQLTRAREKLLMIDSYQYMTKDGKIKAPFKNQTFEHLTNMLKTGR